MGLDLPPRRRMLYIAYGLQTSRNKPGNAGGV
jgi:hypothetical protein